MIFARWPDRLLAEDQGGIHRLSWGQTVVPTAYLDRPLYNRSKDDMLLDHALISYVLNINETVVFYKTQLLH